MRKFGASGALLLNTTFTLFSPVLIDGNQLIAPTDKQRLTGAERLWVQYRDANFSAERELDGEGTGCYPAYYGCLKAVARARIKEPKITCAMTLRMNFQTDFRTVFRRLWEVVAQDAGRWIQIRARKTCVPLRSSRARRHGGIVLRHRLAKERFRGRSGELP